MSTSRAHAAMPMMVTRPSSGPSSDSVRAMAATRSSSSVTSTTIGVPPTAAATRAARSISRSATATRAPASARSREVLSPMPWPPPNTRMRLPARPKSAALISVLQLDDELVVRLGADVARDLDAAALHEHRLARSDRALEVRRQRAGAVGLLHRRDAIAAEDHEDVVEFVLVHVAVGAGREGELPDPHPVVLEHDLVAH